MQTIPDIEPDKFNPINSGVITVHGRGGFNQINAHNRQKIRQLPTLSAKDFEVIALLGAGDVGRVYLIKKSPTTLIPQARGQQYFALKVMSIYDLKKRNKLKRFHSEYDILLTAQHPFVMHLHGAFADERNYYLVMEYCTGGELAQILHKQPGKRFQEQIVLAYSSEVLSALEYLHFHGIIYRDLKTENVLIHPDGHLRLTDFDLAKRVQKERKVQPDIDKSNLFSTQISESSQSFVGTAEYLSPEVLKGEHSQATDFWTLGIFIYELLYGTTPFFVSQGGFAAITRRINSGMFTFPASPKVSEHVKDLIRKLLKPNPAERLGFKYGASEVKKHPWFKNVNFAIVYDPVMPVANVEDVLANFQPIPREAEQMAKEFAGTHFTLPKKAVALIPQAIKLLEQAGMPICPKTIEIGEEFVKEVPQEAHMAATYCSKKTEPRSKLGDLFKPFESSAKQESKLKANDVRNLFSNVDEKDEKVEADIVVNTVQQKKIQNEDSAE